MRDQRGKLLNVGDVVNVADHLAEVMLRDGEAAPAPAVEEIPESPAASTKEPGGVNATSKAVEHAEATRVDLSTVEGTGKDGTVTKADVAAAAAAKDDGA